jgi:hypothetical protein
MANTFSLPTDTWIASDHGLHNKKLKQMFCFYESTLAEYVCATFVGAVVFKLLEQL